jgi:hypothetical protein
VNKVADTGNILGYYSMEPNDEDYFPSKHIPLEIVNNEILSRISIESIVNLGYINKYTFYNISTLHVWKNILRNVEMENFVDYLINKEQYGLLASIIRKYNKLNIKITEKIMWTLHCHYDLMHNNTIKSTLYHLKLQQYNILDCLDKSPLFNVIISFKENNNNDKYLKNLFNEIFAFLSGKFVLGEDDGRGPELAFELMVKTLDPYSVIRIVVSLVKTPNNNAHPFNDYRLCINAPNCFTDNYLSLVIRGLIIYNKLDVIASILFKRCLQNKCLPLVEKYINTEQSSKLKSCKPWNKYINNRFS